MADILLYCQHDTARSTIKRLADSLNIQFKNILGYICVGPSKC